MLWQDGEEKPLQLLVLVLHLKARGNAVARVQERAPLPLLCQVVDEQANLGAHNQKGRTSECRLKTTRENTTDQIGRDEDNKIRSNLFPLLDQLGQKRK